MITLETKNATNRTRLVVYEGHTLGFIQPALPFQISVLKGSLKKGSGHLGPFAGPIGLVGKDESCFRNATVRDFVEFGVCPLDYFLNPEEYEFDSTLEDEELLDEQFDLLANEMPTSL